MYIGTHCAPCVPILASVFLVTHLANDWLAFLLSTINSAPQRYGGLKFFGCTRKILQAQRWFCRTNRQTDGQTDRRTVGQTDRRTDKRTDNEIKISEMLSRQWPVCSSILFFLIYFFILFYHLPLFLKLCPCLNVSTVR